ncbi:MAG TPA: AAA family ATPase [Ktedonobacteraceae bacterium]|nr:AAA family ATPase [Ktedonobacteraceae bacterium]
MKKDERQAVLRTILPYTYIVGQKKLKLALELAYIAAPRIGGVLISGRRGTAKSTTVRAFASMMDNDLPVTIPINATEDRVVGGWEVTELVVNGATIKKVGLLEAAHDKLLYIDEVNLLDDHIINIILDVASTGKLVIQREGLDETHDIETTLVGTMNPEEGGLRPQLLDRFGLMAGAEEVQEVSEDGEMKDGRLLILETVLKFDRALQTGDKDGFLAQGSADTQDLGNKIKAAKARFPNVKLTSEVAAACVKLSREFKVEGHRSDYLLALAACAYAALNNEPKTKLAHLQEVADLVLRHRLPGAQQVNYAQWGVEEAQRLTELLVPVPSSGAS